MLHPLARLFCLATAWRALGTAADAAPTTSLASHAPVRFIPVAFAEWVGTNSSDDLTTIRRQMCKLDLLRIRLMDDRAHDPSTALTAGPCTAQQRPQPALTDRLRPASIPTDTDGYARRPLPLAPHAPHTIPRPHAPYTISRSCTRAYRIPSRAIDSPFRPYPSPASPCHRRCNDRLQP